MGRPLPGYDVVLLDADGSPADEGEMSHPLDPRPVGLMEGYSGRRREERRRACAMALLPHRRRRRSATPTATSPYVGRADDVFKASDYRISPFELESVAIEHPAVGEAAVVPEPGSAAPRRAEVLR